MTELNTTNTSLLSPTLISSMAAGLAGRIDDEFGALLTARDTLRRELLASGEIIPVPRTPTFMPDSIVAIDGARIREQLYAADFLVAGAVTAESLKSRVHHPADASLWSDVVRHGDGTDRLAETAMGAQEILLASRAPHALRILDGGFITPMIALREGLFARNAQVRDRVADLLLGEWDAAATLRRLIDGAPGSLIALAKSDSSTVYVRQFADRFNLTLHVSDRFLATQLLEPGEMLAPRVLSEAANQTVSEPEGSAKVKRAAAGLRETYEHIARLASDGKMRTAYFKPYLGPIPVDTVIRFEYLVADADAVTDMSVPVNYAAVITTDMNAPHLLEPQCQYMVDVLAKDISRSAGMIKNQMIKQLPDERRSSYQALLMQKYRSN